MRARPFGLRSGSQPLPRDGRSADAGESWPTPGSPLPIRVSGVGPDPTPETQYPRLSAGKRRALRERPDLVCQRPSWAILIRRASAAAESLWLAPAVSPKEQRDAHRSAADPAAHPPHSRELHAGKSGGAVRIAGRGARGGRGAAPGTRGAVSRPGDGQRRALGDRGAAVHSRRGRGQLARGGAAGRAGRGIPAAGEPGGGRGSGRLGSRLAPGSESAPWPAARRHWPSA